MGYSLVADLAGFQVSADSPVQIDDPLWQGYLANITPSVFEQRFGHALPDKMLFRVHTFFQQAVHDIAEQYAEEFGREPYIFSISSPGADAFGHVVLGAVS